MYTTMNSTVMGPQVNVAAMAEIVKDLVTGGVARLEDTTWFHRRAAEAQLSLEEVAALEALRVRLSERGTTLLDDIGSVAWS